MDVNLASTALPAFLYLAQLRPDWAGQYPDVDPGGWFPLVIGWLWGREAPANHVWLVTPARVLVAAVWTVDFVEVGDAWELEAGMAPTR